MSAPETRVIPYGLVDMHVHARDFSQAYKEDFTSASQAAIAGGVTAFAAMPNYEPEMKNRPYDRERMLSVQARAKSAVYCDVGMWAASQPKYDNVGKLARLQPLAVGLKFYIEPTQGNEELFSPQEFFPAAKEWHRVARIDQPIAAHAEDTTIEETIAMIAGEIGHPLHIPHVNNRFVLDAVMKAKRNKLPITAGVCPHHLFMTEADVAVLGWRARMKPPLASQEDQDYLWANLDGIDVFETDHAPHTASEKNEADTLNPEGKSGAQDKKCYGVPGLEAMLPLLLQAVHEGKLTPRQLFDKTVVRPRQILGLPKDLKTSVKVSLEQYELSDRDLKSKCSWSPYAGRLVGGRVLQVDVRGQTIYRNGKFIADEPTGKILNSVRRTG